MEVSRDHQKISEKYKSPPVYWSRGLKTLFFLASSQRQEPKFFLYFSWLLSKMLQVGPAMVHTTILRIAIHPIITTLSLSVSGLFYIYICF